MGKTKEIRQIPTRLRNQFMRTKWGQRLAAPLGSELEGRQWIFILGCYNSGTTLLKDILATHPMIGALPGEGVRFTDVLPRPEDFGWNRMWCRCQDQVRLQPGPETAQQAQRIKRHWSILYPTTRPLLLDKSVANTARAPFLAAHFAPASFIYLVRNGYAVAEGIRRKADPAKHNNHDFPSGYPIEMCAEQWTTTDQLITKDRSQLYRFMCLKYEDLASTPKATLRSVTDFLELDPVDYNNLEGSWQVHGIQSEIKNMNQAAIERLSIEDLEKIGAVAGEVLNKYGYT